MEGRRQQRAKKSRGRSAVPCHMLGRQDAGPSSPWMSSASSKPRTAPAATCQRAQQPRTGAQLSVTSRPHRAANAVHPRLQSRHTGGWRKLAKLPELRLAGHQHFPHAPAMVNTPGLAPWPSPHPPTTTTTTTTTTHPHTCSGECPSCSLSLPNCAPPSPPPSRPPAHTHLQWRVPQLLLELAKLRHPLPPSLPHPP